MSFDEYSFADLLSNIVDNRGKTCPVEDEGFPLIATNCIKDDSLYPVFEKVRFVSDDTYKNWFRGHPNAGDIIFVCKGSPGRVAWVKEPVSFCIAQDMVAIRADQRVVDPMFLFLLLRSEQVINKINNMHVGTLIPHFKKGDFKNLYLSIPRDLKLQKAIGLFYFSLSEKIEKNKEINQTLEQIAQALFKSWFADFDPVKAKIAVLEAGGSQEEATLAAMTAISGKNADSLVFFEQEQPEKFAELKATAKLFPSAMQDSELGEIPEGWDSQRLSNLATLHYGKALKKTERIEGPYPVYGSGGVTGSHNNYLVEGPSIVVGRKGSIGTLYWEDRKFHPIDTVYYVANKKGIPLSYLYYLMKTLNLPNMNTDAAVPGLNRDNVYRLEVLKPAQSILSKFDEHMSTIRNIIQKNDNSTVTLIDLRDTLLPKLLSGEITLPEAEQTVSEATHV